MGIPSRKGPKLSKATTKDAANFAYIEMAREALSKAAVSKDFGLGIKGIINANTYHAWLNTMETLEGQELKAGSELGDAYVLALLNVAHTAAVMVAEEAEFHEAIAVRDQLTALIYRLKSRKGQS